MLIHNEDNLFTVSEVRQGLTQIIKDNPDRINPIQDKTRLCLYLSPEGSRCLIGEFMYQANLYVPQRRYAPASMILGDYFMEFDALVLCNNWQTLADAGSILGLTWMESFKPVIYHGLDPLIRAYELALNYG